MRTWIGAVGLAAVTAGGVTFIAHGTGLPTHCGPCVAGTCPANPPGTEPTTAPAGCETTLAAVTPVIDLVDVTHEARTPPIRVEEYVAVDEGPVGIAPDRSPAPAYIPPAVETPF